MMMIKDFSKIKGETIRVALFGVTGLSALAALADKFPHLVPVLYVVEGAYILLLLELE